MRILLFVLIVLPGCSSRLDENALVNGLRDGGLPLVDLGGGTDASPGGNNTAPACDNFDTGPVGQLPAGWTEAHGTWRVSWVDNQRWLQQQDMPSQQSSDFLVWTGDPTWTDAEITAHVKVIGGRSDDCVLARYRPTDNKYYSLCLDNRMGGGGQNSDPRWELSLHANDQRQQLASGSFNVPTADAHDLGLRVVGSTLIATVDGTAQAPVTDTTLTQGALGLSTEDDGRFSRVCTGRR